ncbi:hypothetical protein DSC45_21510 [Streptomyces sp. YIM 130001]|uniref:hypothetical protein n=1 Tax=Streptomyces sp. YIM 130001 TaxID=2259644 RepID=UPI000E655FA0|nr:hypothetical protein [Streptomyces sp. YIM 130001]RII14269.1 hypothetical protein DSC45_21510 [Streptomyces sp. YIM 130001]
MNDLEVAAAQAYVRLLQTARSALVAPDRVPESWPLLDAPIAEVDAALDRAGLSGNEAHLFDLVTALYPRVPAGVDT